MRERAKEMLGEVQMRSSSERGGGRGEGSRYRRVRVQITFAKPIRHQMIGVGPMSTSRASALENGQAENAFS